MIIAALLVGLIVGVLIGFAVSEELHTLDRKRSEEGSLRHTIDHRCEPPFSWWSSTDDDRCLVDSLAYGKKIMPGDVWVCPCLKTYMAIDGKWAQQPRKIEEGAA